MEHSSQLGGGKNHLRIFFFFPALFLLWANTHILFAVGLLFLGIYTMAKIWPLLLDVPALPLFRDWFSLPLCSSFQPAKKNLPLLWLWIACFLVTFINPYGIGIFFEFFTHLSHQWSWNHIAEIQPPTPRLLIANLYYLLAILSIIWLTLYWSAFSLWEWMLLLLSLLMPFLSVKFLPVPFLVALPILARHVSFSAFATAENFKFPPRLNFLIFLTAVLGIFFQFLRVKSMPNPYENAVNFLLKSSPSGNLANHYNDGSYLLYRLWPDKKVFIYSRAPIFSERFLKNDFGGLELEEGSQPWQQVLDKHKIEVVLWPTNRPLTYVLDAAGWKKIYSDKKFSIFERPRD